MSSYQTLLALVFGFWTTWFVLCMIFKKSWIPVIPILPLLALGIGLLLNKVQEWTGTAVVALGHAMILYGMIRQLNRRPKQ